tara:strand:- start:4041 stop:4598 length:558 start_codon:yes stop_codon:yes gene_type:complete
MSEVDAIPAPTEAAAPPSKAARFVDGVLKRCQQDKGLAARLRRADNPSTEYQSWELLAAYNIDLEKSYERLPYAAVGSAMSRAKAERNGSMKLGQAIARCYDDGQESAQAKAKLRRLLACSDTGEACRILRGILTLIASRVSPPLDYARLLTQLLRFHWQPEKIKAQWAQEFYGRNSESAVKEHA